MDLQSPLARIGLDPHERRIYLLLLHDMPLGAGQIAAKTGIHRRTVYDALEKLIARGLVAQSTATRSVFHAADPERLLLFLKEQQEIIQRQESQIRSVLPGLRALQRREHPSPVDARIYSGKEGLKSVMELILKEHQEWLSVGSTGKGPEILPYFLPHWHRRRIKLCIKYRGLFAPTAKGKKRAQEFLRYGLAAVRLLPGHIRQPQTIWIFGSKTAIILVSHQPVAILISSSPISHSFKDYFRLLWTQAEELKKGGKPLKSG